MTQDEKPDSIDNKVDALAAMADGQDISHQGFNAIEDAPAAGESDATAALAAQTASEEAPVTGSDATAALAAQTAPAEAPATASAVGRVVVSGAARKARASTLQRQRSRIHAEQFKRMMVPILLVTGVLLLVLGGIVTVMMRQVEADLAGSTGVFHNPAFKRIMVITAFPLGAILLLGAWLFRADLKRAEAAAQRENAKDQDTER